MPPSFSQQPPSPQTIGYAMRTPVDVDASNLSLLAIFHFVWGGLLAIGSCCPFIHLALGVMIVNGTFERLAAMPPGSTSTGGASPTPLPPSAGWMFIVGASIVILSGWTLAVLTLLSGLWIRRRRRWVFSVVVAACNCAVFPLGTLLGVFTLIVLLRDSVRATYADLPRAQPAHA